MPVDIWLHGTLTARVTLKSAGRKVVLEYTDEARSRYRGGAPILSCSLPAAPGTTAPPATRAYLEGLLSRRPRTGDNGFPATRGRTRLGRRPRGSVGRRGTSRRIRP